MTRAALRAAVRWPCLKRSSSQARIATSSPWPLLPLARFITYPHEMGANAAKQLDIPFNYGMAQLSPSIFIQELGEAAPAPVLGNAN